MYSKTYPPYTPREKLTSSIFDPNVSKRLYLAQQKLRPVLDELMRAATENSKVGSVNDSYHLTVQQFEDAISAYRILKEVDKALSKKGNSKYTKKAYNLNNFDLEKRDVQVNKFGKIFVDTSILIQLIELHKILIDIINNTRESYSEIDFLKHVSSSQECSSSTENNHRKQKDTSNDKIKVSYTHKNYSKAKIKVNLLDGKRIDTKEKMKFSFGQLGKTIVVMPAQRGSSGISEKDRDSHNSPLSTLSEERATNSETNLNGSRTTSRKIKSTGSIVSDDQHVTNVVGARKIILNCLYDLDRVRSFLERTDLSAEVQIQSAILDHNRDTDRTRHVDEQRNSHGHQSVQVDEDPSSHVSEELNFHVDDQTSQGQHSSQENVHPSSKGSVTDRHVYDSKGECCCGSTYASEVPMELVLDAGDDNASKLIICIKGKTEEEGDVQIVIRQCSECKNVGGKDLQEDYGPEGHKDIDEDYETGGQKDIDDDYGTGGRKESHDGSGTGEGKDLHDDSSVGGTSASHSNGRLNIVFDPQHPANSIVRRESDIADTTTHADQESRHSDSSQRSRQSSHDAHPPDDIHHPPKRAVSFDEAHSSVHTIPSEQPSDEMVEPEESEVIDDHSSGAKSPLVEYEAAASDESEKTGIHIIFDPDDPSRSVVEPHKIHSTDSAPTKPQGDQHGRVHRKAMRTGSCSKIELYETANLCLTTDQGQELVISLTVRPKLNGALPQINIKDIFSESTTFEEHDKENDHIFGSEPEFTVEVQDKQLQDDFIPLSRTKVCSSLNFDVSLMETRLEHKGIKHVNQGIVVRLKELGINNLLRACRPVKCGRPAVLNEKSRKGMPYSASLTSLPLEKSDIHIIEQSMQMSFNKLKYISGKSKSDALTYLIELGDMVDNANLKKNIRINFVYVRQPRIFNYKTAEYLVLKKLSYYINLVHDVEDGYKKRTCQIYFFEIKKYHKSDALQKPTSPLLEETKPVKDRNSESNKKKWMHSKNRIQKSIYYPPGSSLLKPSVKTCPGKETPILHSKQKVEYVDSNDAQRENLDKALQNSSKEKMKFSSKIPVYKYTPKNKNISQQDLYTYSVSLKSLPKDDDDVDNVRDTVRASDNKSKTSSISSEVDRHRVIAITRKSIVKVTNSDLEIIDTSKKVSDDSLELYFNNFFRDKYFSKIALSRKQSSCRSLKLRKKKFKYNFSRSHSQTCFGELNVQRYSSTSTNQPGNEKMDVHGDSPSEISDTELKDASLSLANYFTRRFGDFQVEGNVTGNKPADEKNVTSVGSLPSYADMLENEVLQDLFHGMRGKVVEETTYRLSEYLSQPNVEAGMDGEDSSAQMYSLNSLMSFEDSSYKYMPFMRDQGGHDLMRIINKCGNTSHDNFHNLILNLKSNTNRVLSRDDLPSDATMNKIMEKIAIANAFDQDPYYFVYQHSFMQRLLDKSRNLFKYCKRNRYECNDRMEVCSSEDSCRCKSRLENPVDTINDFTPQHTSSELSLKELETTRKDRVCPNCGCIIDKCRSKMAGDNCACSPKGKTQFSKNERKNDQCQGEPLKRRKPLNLCSKKKTTGFNKRSVGVICVPQGVNMATNATLPDRAKGKRGKHCLCVKCDKRSKDGSCFCSHCVGVFDKSVGIKPHNKEMGVQCACNIFSNYKQVACRSLTKTEETSTKELAETSTSKAEDSVHFGDNEPLRTTETQAGGSEQPNTSEIKAEDSVPNSIIDDAQQDSTRDEHVSYVHVNHDFTRKLSGRLYSKIPADFYGESLNATKKPTKMKQ